MPLIHDAFTAANIAGYYDATRTQVNQTLGQKYFPVKKQRGLNLAFIKGAGGRPVVLRASAFDTPMTFRDRISVELNQEKMPFFKEAMLVKEEDRQELALLEMTGNSALIDTITSTIFNDKVTLINGAHARLEAMRMQVLATGMVAIDSNGVFRDIDYQVAKENKGETTIAWGEEGYDPIGDIEEAKADLEDIGGLAEVLILNSKTYGLLRKASSTVARIKPLAVQGATVTNAELDQHLKDNYDLIVQVKNEVFVDDDGATKKFYPDGRLTLAPNKPIGNTVFGTTPEEMDLVSGANLNVAIVDTGIAVTTKTSDDPVNTTTKVTMIALPSFEALDQVYMLDVTVTAEKEEEEVPEG